MVCKVFTFYYIECCAQKKDFGSGIFISNFSCTLIFMLFVSSRTAGLPQYGQLGHNTDNEVHFMKKFLFYLLWHGQRLPIFYCYISEVLDFYILYKKLTISNCNIFWPATICHDKIICSIWLIVMQLLWYFYINWNHN